MFVENSTFINLKKYFALPDDSVLPVALMVESGMEKFSLSFEKKFPVY